MTPCECLQPGYCARHRCYKTPHLFRLCQNDQSQFDLWEQEAAGTTAASSPPAIYEQPPCRHRGADPLRHVECDLCGGRSIQVPVYACTQFGECTPRRYSSRTQTARQMPDCLRCDRYSPASGPDPPVEQHPSADS